MIGFADDEPLSRRDKDRYNRMVFDGQHHQNCVNADGDNCKRRPERECAECRVCPVCNGTLRYEVRSEILSARTTRTSIEYHCVNCGAIIDRGQFRDDHRQAPRSLDPTSPPPCAVVNCKHSVWTGYKVEISGEKFHVCDHHRRFHRRWVLLGKDDQMPHLTPVVGGLMVTIRRKKYGAKK